MPGLNNCALLRKIKFIANHGLPGENNRIQELGHQPGLQQFGLLDYLLLLPLHGSLLLSVGELLVLLLHGSCGIKHLRLTLGIVEGNLHLPNDCLRKTGAPCLRALRPGPFLGFSLYSALRPMVLT